MAKDLSRLEGGAQTGHIVDRSVIYNLVQLNKFRPIR